MGAAIEVAKNLAGERHVAVAAGEVGGQAGALGLVDEGAMDVLPVVFGTGPRQVIASWSPARGMSGWLRLECGAKIWRDGSTTQEAVPRVT